MNTFHNCTAASADARTRPKPSQVAAYRDDCDKPFTVEQKTSESKLPDFSRGW